MKKLVIVLILGVVFMVPSLASAIFYTDRAAWESAVATYMDVTDPATNLAAYAAIPLPSGGGDVFNINVPLSYSIDFYYTSTQDTNQNYYANGTFYNMPNSWTFNLNPVSAFGFDMVPAGTGSLTINLYTVQQDVLSQVVNLSTGPEFFGWVGDNVVSFSTWASASYGLGNFVQGGPAAVPEPATMLLLGSGLVGLAGLGRRKFFKK